MTAANAEQSLSQLASALWSARRAGRRLDSSEVSDGLTLDRAYAVQGRYLGQSGRVSAGLKIGATSIGSQSMLALAAPFSGPILDRTVFGAAAAAPVPGHPIFAEAELCLRLDRPWSDGADPNDALSVALAIELCSPRFDGELRGQGLAAIADGGICHAVIVGSFAPLDEKLFHEELTLSVEGGSMATGRFSDLVWSDLHEPLRWLTTNPFARNHAFDPGFIVMTGSCTGMTPVTAGDRVKARSSSLGELECRLVRAAGA